MMKDKKTINEIYNNIRLINYNRGLTIFENNLIIEQPKKLWRDTENGENVINMLFSTGHNIRDVDWTYADSSNLAFNMAAVQSIKQLNEKMIDLQYNLINSKFKVTVKPLAQTNPGGLVYDSFSLAMLDDLKKKIANNDGSMTNRNVGDTFLLLDFYFNFGKIMKVIQSGGGNYNNYLFPDGAYNFFTQLYGTDKVRVARDNIDANNKDYQPYYLSNGKMSQRSSNFNDQTVKDLVKVAHVVLPIVALIVTLGTAGVLGLVVGAGIELIDAALYKYVDDDPYMAGVAAIFAFAGPLDNVLGPYAKIYGKQILIKLYKKQTLTAIEKRIMKYVKTANKHLVRLTRLGMARHYIKLAILKLSNASSFLKYMFWLIKKGFNFTYFLSRMGLWIGGPMFTWDVIANKLGICNSMPIVDLKQSDWKIFKIIGTAGEYLQPYSTSCDKIALLAEAEKMERMLKRETKFRIKSLLESLIKNNTIFSIKNPNQLWEIELLQSVLTHFGFSYLITSEKKVDKSKWSKQQCTDAIVKGIDVYSWSQHPECNQYKQSKPMSKETEKLLKMKPLNDKYTNKSYGVGLPFNWGHYDKQTKDMVTEFQKKHLDKGSVDGIMGPKTFKKMLELINSLSESTDIKNYSDIKWTTGEIERLRKEYISHVEKYISNNIKNGDKLNKETIDNAFMDQKDSIANEIYDGIVNLKFDKDLTDTTTTDIVNKYEEE